MVARSASLAALVSVRGSSVSRPQVIKGRAAFLAPEMRMVPESGTPPVMRIESISTSWGERRRAGPYISRICRHTRFRTARNPGGIETGKCLRRRKFLLAAAWYLKFRS